MKCAASALIIYSLCGLATSAVTASAQAESHSQERKVPHKIKVNKIAALREDPGRHRLVVVTDRSGPLWFDTTTLDRYGQKCIASAKTDRTPVVIEFDPQNGEITSASLPIVDPIVFLGDPEREQEAVRVTAMKRPTALALRKDNPEFRELYSILAEAFAKHRDGWKAALAVPHGSQSIVDAVLIPPDGHR